MRVLTWRCQAILDYPLVQGSVWNIPSAGIQGCAPYSAFGDTESIKYQKVVLKKEIEKARLRSAPFLSSHLSPVRPSSSIFLFWFLKQNHLLRFHTVVKRIFRQNLYCFVAPLSPTSSWVSGKELQIWSWRTRLDDVV